MNLVHPPKILVYSVVFHAQSPTLLITIFHLLPTLPQEFLTLSFALAPELPIRRPKLMAYLRNRAGGPMMLRHVMFALSIAAAVLDPIRFAAHAADPDPMQDFCVADLDVGVHVNGYACKARANVTSDDFLFTGLRNKGNTSASGTGAVITYALVQEYPGLNTQGISHVRLDLEPGGVIPPHTHPLATETIFVVEGTVYTGFVSHDNRLFAKVLQKGDLFFFPRGTLHFQENVGSEAAVCFNSFNGQFPALLLGANQLLTTNFSDNVLTKSFGASEATIAYLKSVVPRYWG